MRLPRPKRQRNRGHLVKIYPGRCEKDRSCKPEVASVGFPWLLQGLLNLVFHGFLAIIYPEWLWNVVKHVEFSWFVTEIKVNISQPTGKKGTCTHGSGCLQVFFWLITIDNTLGHWLSRHPGRFGVLHCSAMQCEFPGQITSFCIEFTARKGWKLSPSIARIRFCFSTSSTTSEWKWRSYESDENHVKLKPSQNANKFKHTKTLPNFPRSSEMTCSYFFSTRRESTCYI